jgi:hypothetical protein
MRYCFIPFLFILAGCFSSKPKDEIVVIPESKSKVNLDTLWESQMLDNAAIMIAIRPELKGNEVSLSLYDSVLSGVIGLTGSPASDLVDKYRLIVKQGDSNAVKKISQDKQEIDKKTDILEAQINDEKKKSAELEEKNKLLQLQHERDRKDKVYFLLTAAGTAIIAIGAFVGAFGSIIRGLIIGAFGASLAALPWLLDSVYFVPILLGGLGLMLLEGIYLIWKRNKEKKNCLTQVKDTV